MRSPNLRARFRQAIQLYPVTAGALVALTVAALALVLVLDEQSKGRGRDQALKSTDGRLVATDGRLAGAIRAIQASRREGVLISCKTNQSQNNVLLALIELSISRARAQGRVIDPEALARTRKLVRPITPEATQAVCDALLERVSRGPPPPP